MIQLEFCDIVLKLGQDMPESMRNIFLHVFSKLKQRVVWKWENDTMENQPENVKLSYWLPQQDILGNCVMTGVCVCMFDLLI